MNRLFPYIVRMGFVSLVAALIGVGVAMIAGIALKGYYTPKPKQKDYILHSITSDGTAFYLYMDEEEYQQWASENHIKIKKLRLEND